MLDAHWWKVQLGVHNKTHTGKISDTLCLACTPCGSIGTWACAHRQPFQQAVGTRVTPTRTPGTRVLFRRVSSSVFSSGRRFVSNPTNSRPRTIGIPTIIVKSVVNVPGKIRTCDFDGNRRESTERIELKSGNAEPYAR